MKAIPTLERYVYSVPSDRNPRVCYRVDLTANKGATFCSCTDFATRRQPAIDEGKPILTNETLCKHGKRALWQFLREVMPRLAAEEDRPKRRPISPGRFNGSRSEPQTAQGRP